MRLDLVPGTGGVVRFPTERRAKPTLTALCDLAPREDLAAAMADERDGNDEAPDTLAQTVAAFTTLLDTLEFPMGRDAALAHLRGLVAPLVAQAHALCWAYQDAEAEAEDAQAKLRAAKRSGAGAFADRLDDEVRRTRTAWTERALAARAATDAALGAQAALDWHEHGTPWRRTGVDTGDWLPDTPRVRTRQDEPA